MGKNKLSQSKLKNVRKGKSVNKVVKTTNKKQKTKKKVIAKPVIKNNEEVIEDESDNGEDMLDMVDKDDLSFLKQAVLNNSYSLFKKVHVKRKEQQKTKRKREETDIEEIYEQLQPETKIRTKNLLPIKTQTRLITREIVDTSVESDDEVEEKISEKKDDLIDGDNEEFEFVEDQIDASQPLSTAEILAKREETLRNRKIQIGILCSGLLESPEDKILNFKKLIEIINDQTHEIYATVRKLAIVSLLEVFKDLLPSYQIRLEENKDVKMKKDTIKIQRYESSLLIYYKKYLKNLEKFILRLNKKGGNKEYYEENMKLAELSLHCMCDLLITHPYFNFSENIAQTIVPFLNHRFPQVRQKVNLACQAIFKDDKRGEITLKILRIINQYLKTHSHNVRVEMIDVLLALKIKDVNLDEEKEELIKQKKFNARKQKILQSRKEKKWKKQLQELEKELLETKAQESKEKKQKNLTEITKIVFGIYFRILKTSNNSKILGSCLEGLAKFAHVINLEYYSDLVRILHKLLKENWLSYREQLNCIHTVLVMLSGQGEVINLDPSEFYTSLYANLLTTHAGRNHADFITVLETLNEALIQRRKKVTHQRLISFTKRLCTLSLQLLHNGSLSSLGLVKSIMQVNKFTDILLDLDTSVGDGRYLPELEDPEYCNAANTALYELIPLRKHYHPTVSKMAKHISIGVPSSGDGSLPPDLGKCSAEQLFKDFDPTEVCFKPAIPIPNKSKPKARSKYFQFSDPTFKDYCKQISRKKLCKNESGLYFII